MKLLGIDFGERKAGIAISQNGMVDPLTVAWFADIEALVIKIREIAYAEQVDKIIVGKPEGRIEGEVIAFAKQLESRVSLPVILFDETLSSHDARELSIAAGHSQKKRKEMEDAFAAALILTHYLETTKTL